MDILLNKEGDLHITPDGDIVLGNSIAQKISCRLKMFEGEWRYDPDEGIPYFNYLFQKNPDTDYLESVIRAKIFEVPEVTEVKDVSISADPKTRSGAIRYVALTDQETIKEEVKIQWQITE